MTQPVQRRMTEPSPFAHHEIVNRVLTPEIGSWLLKRPEPGANPDGYTNVLGCRVTAADGLLTVTGDFLPTTFSVGPRDPVVCVRWIGHRRCMADSIDSYVAEKARNGSGRDSVTAYDVSLAKSQLRTILAEGERDDAPGWWTSAIRSGIDLRTDYDGREGVHQILHHVMSGHDSELLDEIAHIGKRPATHLILAVQALNRLVELLTIEVAP